VYQETMRQFQAKLLPENHPLTEFCAKVVNRLGPATGVTDVTWKVHVINDDIPNAFVIPGGQIFIFTVHHPLHTDVDSWGRGFFLSRRMKPD